MITHIRKFNELGIEKFRNLLHEIKTGEADSILDSFVTDSHFCEIINAEIKIERKKFDTKNEIIRYIYDKISRIPGKNLLYDAGLWSWLSAFYFDSIWKPNSSKTRGLGEDARYILNAEEWNKYYRHLLASPTRLLKELDDLAKIYLAGTPDKNGDLHESLASRQEIAACKAVIEAATILYWDDDKQKIKVKARNKDGAGVLRRFAKATIPQFQMTYDFNSMSGKEVIQLLPKEYKGWITPSKDSVEVAPNVQKSNEMIIVNKVSLKKSIGRKLAAPVSKTWVEDFVDEDTGEVVSIERNETLIEREEIIIEKHIDAILNANVKSIILYKEY